MTRQIFQLEDGTYLVSIDYKAPHANRPTPPRRHYPRDQQGNKPLFRV